MNTQNTAKSLNFNKNDLVLIIGESMGTNCADSLKFAQELGSSGKCGKVLFVNTIQPQQKFLRTVRQTLGREYDIKNNSDNIICLTRPGGTFCFGGDEVDTYCRESGVDTIVINCWELLARDYRMREKLLFMMMNWLHQYSATIILYAQKSTVLPQAGYMQRGGFGKYAGIADRVVKAFEDKAEERDIMTIPFALLTTEEQWLRTEKEKLSLGSTMQDEPIDEIDDEAELYEAAEAEPKMQTTISPSGFREMYEEFSESIDEEEPIIKQWDKQGIARSERRVYFYGNPEGMKFAHLVEERMTKKRIHCRSLEVSPKDYNFPAQVPLENNPEVGITLEAYLQRYRKATPSQKQEQESANVQNHIIEIKGVTEQLLSEPAWAG